MGAREQEWGSSQSYSQDIFMGHTHGSYIWIIHMGHTHGSYSQVILMGHTLSEVGIIYTGCGHGS